MSVNGYCKGLQCHFYVGWLTFVFMATDNTPFQEVILQVQVILIKGTRVQKNLYGSVTIYSLDHSA